jgi:hypothetical protein
MQSISHREPAQEPVSDSRQSFRNKPAGRLIELDILRGFLLLWMTLTHLPTKVSVVSNQTFGFVSGAEGFIFLAGFMVGQLEVRREKKGGEWATLRDLARRTARIYSYHLALIFIAFTVFAEIAVRLQRPAVENLFSYFLQSKGEATLAAVLLQYRPSLLDILPMYVVFMVLTPLARRASRRWGWDPVIYISFAIWVSAQFGIRAYLYRHFRPFGIWVPESSTGAFDLYGWQLLWIVALALGTLCADSVAGCVPAQGERHELGMPAWLVNLSVVVAGVFLVLRYSPLDHWVDPNLLGWLIDKWHLGPVRVINFAAIAIVLARFGSRLAALRVFSPLALLGQASLEVFCVHVLCCLAGDSLSLTPDPNLPWGMQIPLLVVTVSLLFLTAVAHRGWKQHRASVQSRQAA